MWVMGQVGTTRARIHGCIMWVMGLVELGHTTEEWVHYVGKCGQYLVPLLVPSLPFFFMWNGS